VVGEDEEHENGKLGVRKGERSEGGGEEIMMKEGYARSEKGEKERKALNERWSGLLEDE